jgi:hypothetical protein
MTAAALVTSLQAQEKKIYDSDGDGWCDLWCNLFQVEHRNKRLDSDNDGVTDFEEMLAMKNPFAEEGPPVDQVAARRAAKVKLIESQKAWDARVAQLPSCANRA